MHIKAIALVILCSSYIVYSTPKQHLLELNQTLQTLHTTKTPPQTSDFDPVLAAAIKKQAHEFWNTHISLIGEIYEAAPNISVVRALVVRQALQLGIQLRNYQLIYLFETEYRTLLTALHMISNIVGALPEPDLLEQIQQLAQNIFPLISHQETEGTRTVHQAELKKIVTLFHLDKSPQSDAVSFENIDTIREYGLKNPLSTDSTEQAENKVIKIEFNNSYVVKARGDGNCFYRSFLFSFVATTIMLDKKEDLQHFITQLQNSFIDIIKPLGLSQAQQTNALNYLLNQLDKLKQIESTKPALEILRSIQFIFNYPLFDFLTIMYVRYNIAKYITEHPDITLPTGITFKDSLSMSISDYINTIILTWGEDAQGSLYAIIPFVFNINFVGYDMRYSQLKYLLFNNQPALSFVILKPGHYDAVITKPDRKPHEQTIINYYSFWEKNADLIGTIMDAGTRISKQTKSILQDAIAIGHEFAATGQAHLMVEYEMLNIALSSITMITGDANSAEDLATIKQQVNNLSAAYQATQSHSSP